MKLYHHFAYLYHKLIRRFHRREGKYQTAAFEHHHHKMKYHRQFFPVGGTFVFGKQFLKRAKE